MEVEKRQGSQSGLVPVSTVAVSVVIGSGERNDTRDGPNLSDDPCPATIPIAAISVVATPDRNATAR